MLNLRLMDKLLLLTSRLECFGENNDHDLLVRGKRLTYKDLR